MNFALFVFANDGRVFQIEQFGPVSSLRCSSSLAAASELAKEAALNLKGELVIVISPQQIFIDIEVGGKAAHFNIKVLYYTRECNF